MNIFLDKIRSPEDFQAVEMGYNLNLAIKDLYFLLFITNLIHLY